MNQTQKKQTTAADAPEAPHKFVPDSTSPSLNCEICGESREYHWRKGQTSGSYATEQAADKTAHTPGPWKIGQSIGLVFDADENELCELAPGEDRTIEANARLIAAAPTMLQALKDLTAQIQLGKLNIRKDFSLMNAHAAATKAIFQAEGE